MSYPFNYQGVHACEAMVLSCIDFRFWPAIIKYVEEELGIKDFDFPSLPGAAKAINNCDHDNAGLAMSCVDVPCNLHHVKKLIIVNHADCGAYGGRAKFDNNLDQELEFHKAELAQAKALISAKHPDKEVITLFAQLDIEKSLIDILTIK